MKRLFVSAALLTFSLGSYAFAGHMLSGGGEWNSSDGSTGTYTQTLVATHQDGSVLIDERITVGEHVMDFQFTILPVDDMRYKIQVEGNTVGGGYCWHIGEHSHELFHGEKICHSTMKKADGSWMENSMHIAHGSVHLMGSVWNPATKVHVAWKGALSSSED